MTRRAAALALVAALAAPAAATAHEPSHLRLMGGCEQDAHSVDAVAPDRYTGVVYAALLAYSLSPQHNPVTVTSIRCEVLVNGAPAASSAAWPGAGPVGVVPPSPVTYTATDVDHVLVCTLLELVDGHGDATTLRHCPGARPNPFPPPELYEHVDDLFVVADELGVPADDLVHGTLDGGEDAVCDALRAVAPLTPLGPVTIEAGGDVYVSGVLWWDCPPYENGPAL